MVPPQPSRCSHDGRQQCCGACRSPGSACNIPSQSHKDEEQLGQPLDQSGSNVGQLVPLGCSQPSPQQNCRPHPAQLEALELKGRLEPAAGWGLLDLEQSWGTSSHSFGSRVGGALVLVNCLVS